VVGAEAFLTGCTPKRSEDAASWLDFTPDRIGFLDEVGETILPATAASPGAKEAKIGEFMKAIVTDCYEEKDQHVFMDGINKLNDASNQKYSKDFMKLEPNEKHDLLVALDTEARDYSKNRKENEPEKHYFSLMKQLTLWGYFTSEVGSKQALRYLPLPGKYEGCIDYKKGDKAWSAI
jgi:hypothetical protein